MKNIRKNLAALLLSLLFAQGAAAQFRVVDAESGAPIPGAYILDSKGQLLEMTDKDGRAGRYAGRITVSMMSYGSQTVDGATQTADVRLTPKPFSLGEATVGRSEYVKTTGVFRDVVRREGDLVVYREGIADFYYDTFRQKYTRRVRACRQYVADFMTKTFNFSMPPVPFTSFDFSNVKLIDRGEVVATKGDSVIYRVGGRDGAVIEIADPAHGVYRTVIDMMKTDDNIPNPIYFFKKRLCDWTYGDARKSNATLKSFASFTELRYTSPGKALRNIRDTDAVVNGNLGVDVSMSQEFVITDIVTMTKEEAKAEMKDKSETNDFRLPDVLPQLPFDLATDAQGLRLVRFAEY